MRKLTSIAAAVGSALLLTYGATAQASIVAFAPSAYAESELLVSKFRFMVCQERFYSSAFSGTHSCSHLGFNPGRTVAASAHWAHLRASFAAAMVMLGMQAVSSTTLDPGILFFTFAAIAIVAREGLRAGRRATLKEQRARAAAAHPEPTGALPRQRPGLKAR